MTTTLQSLTDSLWTFAALLALGEAGAFPLLKQGTTLQALNDKTDISEDILTAALNLLITLGWVVHKNGQFKASGDLNQSLVKGGSARVQAQMQSHFGQIRELIAAAKSHQLKIGWHHTDKDTLQAQGLFSELVVTDFLPASPELMALMQKENATFLDVGAGVARISLKLCETYPQVRAVALEPAEAPFALAQENIARSPQHNRVDLRKIGMEDLKDEAAFDVIWLAQGFIADEFFIPALPALKKALKTGGRIVTAVLSEESDPSYVKRFFTTLHGGGRSQSELIRLLDSAGFTDIKEILKSGPYVVLTAAGT